MRPLVTNQRVMTWLSIRRTNKKTHKLKKFLYYVFTMAIVMEFLTVFSGSLAFFVKFASINLEEALYALFQIAGIFGSLYMLIVGIMLGQQIVAIFDKLSDIYNAYKNDGTFEFVLRVNEKSEWIWKMYFTCVLGGFCVNTLCLVSISAVYCWMVIGHFDSTVLYHTYKIVLPWNQTTVVGYILQTCFDLLSCEFYFISNGSFLLLFLSMCLHHDAFYKMFRSQTYKLNYLSKNQSHIEVIIKLIRFHANAKEWFLQSADVYRHFVLVQLITSVLFLTCILFQLDLQLKHPDVGLGLVFCGILVSGANIFVYCFYGEMATESYIKISDCVYEANWPQLTVNLQKYFIIMIANEQKPLYYHGFGIAVLNMETFLKLLRAVATYYTVFKTITK